jgi:type IV pilus assembly protein PilM
VDLGATSVKLAQLKTIDEEVELLAAGAVEVPPAGHADERERLALLGDGIQTILKRGTFHSRQCILGLPAHATFVHHVKVPKASAEDTAKAVLWELQGKLPCPVEDAVVRYVVAGEVYGDGETKQEVVTVSASRRTLYDYLAMARRAKLDVVGMNVASCAIVECFARLFKRGSDAARAILYIGLGHSSTQAVLTHGSRIAFARDLPMGCDRFDAAVASGLGVDAQQAHAMRRDLQGKTADPSAEDAVYHCLDRPIRALVDEVTQCLRYYESVFRNQAVERAIFLGGQAYDKRLCQTIAQQLNLPAQTADPLMRVKRVDGAGLEHGLDRREPQPDWAVAVGLSLGAAQAA